MTRPRPDQIDELWNRLKNFIDGHPEVMLRLALERERRAGSTIPDGYPTATMGDGGHAGAHIVADGERVPVTATELAAFARVDWQHQTDAHHIHAKGMLADLLLIVARIDSFSRHALAIQAARRELPSDDAIWCKHHSALGFSEPVGDSGRRGLCQWCEGFEREHRCLPPKPLLDRKARGERLNSAQIAVALGVKVA